MNNTQHYNLNWQIFPWLEGSFRYTGLSHFDPEYPVYYDRSFAFKARLLDETDILPSLAVGVNDAVGTGLYAGEYLVASKRLGAIDGSIGIGFGRLGGGQALRNPLTLISNSFSHRTLFPEISPGATAFNTWFHGENAGLFGSVIWNTPLEGLSVLAEYSSDRYSLEGKRGTVTTRSQLNYGISYQVSDGTTASLGWMYGTSLSGALSFQLDPTKPQYLQKIGPDPTPPTVRPIEERQRGIAALSEYASGKKNSTIARWRANNEAVDTLWSVGSHPLDVYSRGTNLFVELDSEPRRSLCKTMSGLLSGTDTNITTIFLTSKRSSIRCAVPRTVAVNYAMSELASKDLLPSAASLETIDASVGAVDRTNVQEKISLEAEKQGILIESISSNSGSMTIYYNNSKYFAEVDALTRLTSILLANAPSDVEQFRLIAVGLDIPLREFDVLRSVAERNFEQDGAVNIFDSAVTQRPAPMENPQLDESGATQRFAWNIYPQFRQQLFDPSNPFAVQFLAAGYVSLELLRGLTLNAEGELSLYDNFNHRPSDSVLPHVRTDFQKYFTDGKNGIGQIDAEYRYRFSPTVFGVVKSGILESMFGGAGGEILWRPEDARWGIGMDAYEVWQRNYDRLFGFLPYRAFTGHISLYYQAPWYNLNFALRAGQYLAGDRGATLEVTRRFSTGVEIGAFVTKTNVSAAEFGEGSFDKGIIIRIPLGWIAPMEAQSLFAMDLRPVQRDGGQRLAGDATLWEETRRSSEGEILNTLGRN